MLVGYSLLHFLVDGVCAFAMLFRFYPGVNGYFALLIYNFCAFALQMPLGVLLDRLPRRQGGGTGLCACLGLGLTISGAVCSPILLGFGNALFHIGAGTAILLEDRKRARRGAELGVFVAPGAVGLFVGRFLAGKAFAVRTVLFTAALLMLLALLPVLFGKRAARSASPETPAAQPAPERLRSALPAVICCFHVVVLRSYTGLSVRFTCASGTVFTLLTVLATAAGKLLGGVLAARFGDRRAAICSLPAAALCFLCAGGSAAAAVGALLLFNMTMPLTLYEPVRRMPENAGFFFGLLTFGLFLGFLPVWFGWDTLPGPALGAASCLLSLALLLPALGERGRIARTT